MRFSVLSSGSKANCTVVQGAHTTMLIDCGLSGKKTEERLKAVGIDSTTLNGIIVTHEHHDHIHGVGTISRKYKLPVFANHGTKSFLPAVFHHELFVTGEQFSVGEFSIDPIRISHDAVDPVGFIIHADGFRFAYFTDLGCVTQLVKTALVNINALVLESNHDEELLRNCMYSWDLKSRIASSHGHLSNAACGELLKEITHPELGVVVLGHISENANTPKHAQAAAEASLEGRKAPFIVCGSVGAPTAMFHIEATLASNSPKAA